MFPLLAGYYDTPFIVWLLKTQAKYNTKVFFEDQLGINRHWMQMEWGEEEVDTLITHYAGVFPLLHNGMLAPTLTLALTTTRVSHTVNPRKDPA